MCVCVCVCPQMQGSRASSGERVWKCFLLALSMSPFQGVCYYCQQVSDVCCVSFMAASSFPLTLYHTLTLLHTHSTNLFTYPFSHSLTCSLTQSLTHSHGCTPILSLPHSPSSHTHPLIHSLPFPPSLPPSLPLPSPLPSDTETTMSGRR